MCTGDVTKVCAPVNSAAFDISGFINSFIEKSAADLSRFPNAIYRSLLSELSSLEQGIPLSLPKKSWVYSRVRTLRGTSGLDSFLAIEQPPYSDTVDGLPMLQRHWYGRIDGKFQRFVIWTTDECLSYLRYDGHVFIDATFKVVPHPFSQCLIVQ